MDERTARDGKGASDLVVIRGAKETLCCSHEEKMKRPGVEAFKALSLFLDIVVSVCRCMVDP